MKFFNLERGEIMEVLIGNIILMIVSIIIVNVTVRNPEFKKIIARMSAKYPKEDDNVPS
jgi:hypothetical protein